jgi:hypothetical protein
MDFDEVSCHLIEKITAGRLLIACPHSASERFGDLFRK